MSESITDLLREEAVIIEAEGAAGHSVDLLIDAADEITTLRQQLSESQARVAELSEALALLREPWDLGQILRAETRRRVEHADKVLQGGNYRGRDLRLQADAVEVIADKLEGMNLMRPDEFLRSNAQRLRQQAEEAERAGGAQ